MTGMGSLGYKYNGALDALQSIVRNEGVRGLYRGLWPNLREFDFFYLLFLGWPRQRGGDREGGIGNLPQVLFIDFEILAYGLCVYLFCCLVKVAPSIATSFFTYELVKEFLGAS